MARISLLHETVGNINKYMPFIVITKYKNNEVCMFFYKFNLLSHLSQIARNISGKDCNCFGVISITMVSEHLFKTIYMYM